MISPLLSPSMVRVETSTICQLKCPCCPTPAAGEFLGRGMLSLENFRRLLDGSPHIRLVELASKGEALLNKDLPAMLRYAHERGVATSLNQGANFNDVSDEALEALVRYGTARVRISIDGATQETYARYRVGGNLGKVLDNVRKINALKKRHGIDRPVLIFQFIPFAHNVHEMRQAVLLARMLNMQIVFHLADLCPEPMSEADKERIRSILGYADREEFFRLHGRHYMHPKCYQMWVHPQINWDGRLLGCSKNLWSAYGENVFENGLVNGLNSEGMRSARRVLAGLAPPANDLPCLKCPRYVRIEKEKNWITGSEIDAWQSTYLSLLCPPKAIP